MNPVLAAALAYATRGWPVMDYAKLQSLLGCRTVADVACPECGPLRHDPRKRVREVLRLWRLSDRVISFHCARCGSSGYAAAEHSRRLSSAERAVMKRRSPETREKQERDQRFKQNLAAKLWRESIDSRNTWAEIYLRQRGVELPAEDYLRRRTLRFHHHCPFPDRKSGPALLVAFEPILPDVPLLDPPVTAIHRIRGRGQGNKAMLGATGGRAMKITPDERVHGRLSISEGVETGLKLFERGMPIWALGSAGAIEAFPVIERVRELTIFADNDASKRGLDAAKRCAGRWQAAGKQVVVFMRPWEGQDYGEA